MFKDGKPKGLVMDDFEKELKVGFLEEIEQALADAELCFMQLESDPNNSENIHKIFRLAHNMKGGAKAVGFEQLGNFSHEFENYILKIKNKEMQVTDQVVNVLLECNDFLKSIVTGLKNDLSAQFDLVPYLNLMLAAPSSDNKMEQPPVQEKEITEPKFEVIVNATVDDIFARPNRESSKTQAITKEDESIRVSLSKIEKLINLIGEMSILQTVLNEQLSADSSALVKKATGELTKIGKEVQSLSMGLRMLPVKPLFQKMLRIVRDSSKELGKNIELELKGEETELDKSIIEKISDPLVHLIRNSVDHGIESQEMRIARGKNPTGTITLAAYHRGDKIVIAVSDDGGGLNGEKIRKKAIEKKLISEQDVLTEKEMQNLIFLPGFSTKETVTNLSGRGVGMDVVKTNIQDLNGVVELNSVVEKGSEFLIVLPLTLAIIDAMIITVDDQKFVIPTALVFETLRPKDHKIMESSIGLNLQLRGEIIPLFSLADILGRKAKKSFNDQLIMIFESNGKKAGLIIDDIINQIQVVIKQLDEAYAKMKGITGSTILGDGKAALILEPNELIKNFIPKITSFKVNNQRTAI